MGGCLASFTQTFQQTWKLVKYGFPLLSGWLNLHILWPFPMTIPFPQKECFLTDTFVLHINLIEYRCSQEKCCKFNHLYFTILVKFRRSAVWKTVPCKFSMKQKMMDCNVVAGNLFHCALPQFHLHFPFLPTYAPEKRKQWDH